MQGANAYLVESIPWGLEDLRTLHGVRYTEEVLPYLVDRAQNSIDLTAMYWSLLPDGAGAGEAGFSDQQLEALGAEHGQVLYQALEKAAQRGVQIRIVQSPGFSDADQESRQLALAYPKQIQIRQVDMSEWYNDGIMHQKLWIFDRRDIYIGSANMDWRALSQVKELGIVVENSHPIANDLSTYFDTWWFFAALEPADTCMVFDPRVQLTRRVPPWSSLGPGEKQKPSPLGRDEFQTSLNLSHPIPFAGSGQKGSAFITGSPPELCPPGRTFDLDGLLYTIQDAREKISISVMSFGPISHYDRDDPDIVAKEGEEKPPPTPVWWPVLMNALLQAVLTRGIQVRLLVSQWAHSSPFSLPALHTWQEMANAYRIDDQEPAGRLEIKRFVIPGWDQTCEPEQHYPDHSRVNHTKYVVTDRRLNIGTSNMTWSYFASCAGTSFNTDRPDLVAKLQELFDRDWESRYVHPLPRFIKPVPE